MPNRRTVLLATALLPLAAAARAAASPVVEIWKDPACGCCRAWAQRMEEAAFATRIRDVDDLATIAARLAIPDDLAGCHHARIDDYVLSGHVPPVAVQRLLAERPAIAGLAVPGMPLGSPGMEVLGTPPDPYDVIAFTRDGIRITYLAVRP